MSRFTKIMLALLASMAVAAPAFAVTGDVSGLLHVRGVAADNMDGRDKDDDAYDDNTRAVDERLRLFTTAALNENVKAVFTVEVDYVWGDDGVGDLGADEKGEIEIANLYLDFNIPEADTNVKAGTHYYKLGSGLILGEHASGVSIRKAIDDTLNLDLYWVKAVEGDDEDDDEDVDYYQVQLGAKVGETTISPFVGYLDADDGYFEGETEEYYYGVDLKGKAEALEYGGTVFYNDGSVEGEHNDAFAFLINTGYTLNDTKLIAELARYGDSDVDDGQMVTVYGYNNFSEILTGGFFDKRSTGGGTATSTLDKSNNAYYYNFQYVKLGVEQKIGDSNTIRAYYIYAQQAADNDDAVGARRLTFGHELDAYYDYIIVPGLTMTVGGGYLLADDDYGITSGGSSVNKNIGGDDAWKAGLGLAYKF